MKETDAKIKQIKAIRQSIMAVGHLVRACELVKVYVRAFVWVMCGWCIF
jgi:hypothetical protein